MAIEDQIINILTSEAAGSISFSFSTTTTSLITVNVATFITVATLIRSGRIRVQRADLEGTTQGQYLPESDTILIEGGFGQRRRRAAIIHENLPHVDDETAAYLAEAVFLVRTGLPLARWRGIRSLLAPANTIISNGSPTNSQVEMIRNTIMRNPVYRADYI